MGEHPARGAGCRPSVLPGPGTDWPGCCRPPGCGGGPTVAVARGTGVRSLLLALLARASASGAAWVGVVGRPELGLVAAAEAGLGWTAWRWSRPGATTWWRSPRRCSTGWTSWPSPARAGRHAPPTGTAARARRRGAVLLVGGRPGADAGAGFAGAGGKARAARTFDGGCTGCRRRRAPGRTCGCRAGASRPVAWDTRLLLPGRAGTPASTRSPSTLLPADPVPSAGQTAQPRPGIAPWESVGRRVSSGDGRPHAVRNCCAQDVKCVRPFRCRNRAWLLRVTADASDVGGARRPGSLPVVTGARRERRAGAGARAVVTGLAGHRRRARGARPRGPAVGGGRREPGARLFGGRPGVRCPTWPASPGGAGPVPGAGGADPATPTATPGVRAGRRGGRGARTRGGGGAAGVACAARAGPAGYFGGELAAAEQPVDQAAARTGVEGQAGVADGLFAAVLAARRGLAVAPGAAPAFLAPSASRSWTASPTSTGPSWSGCCAGSGCAAWERSPRWPGRRGLPVRGGRGARHRLARGLDPRPPVRRRPPEELTVEQELDPPVDRVDTAAFAARGLAERLHAPWLARAVVHPARGRRRAPRGRAAAPGLAVRRAAHPGRHRRPRPLAARRLAPPGLVAARAGCGVPAVVGAGGDGRGGGAAARAVGRGRGGRRAGGSRAGPGAGDARAGVVFTAVLGGGRDPAERVRLVAWGDDRADAPVPGFRRPVPRGRTRGVRVSGARSGGSWSRGAWSWGARS